MSVVFAAIGNSDDKLTQTEWVNYEVDLLDVFAYVGGDQLEIHGVWYSHPTSPFQNMCVCADVPDQRMAELKELLGGLAKEYRQDSVQFSVVDESKSGGIIPTE